MENLLPVCPSCASDTVKRAGFSRARKQRLACRDCNRFFCLDPQTRVTDPVRQAQILAACQERMSQRGVARVFGVSRNTVAKWLKKVSSLPPLKKALVKAKRRDVLELDEMWSFVQQRRNKRWVWLAQCRRSLQIVAYAIGDRSEATCRLLWERIPKRYKRCVLFTDFWKAYAEVLPEKQHRATGKGDGQTCHVERFNNILRQRLGRFVRRTLSFSKNDQMHENCLLMFLHDYNTKIQHRLKCLL